jgi:hypothetical protein
MIPTWHRGRFVENAQRSAQPGIVLVTSVTTLPRVERFIVHLDRSGLLALQKAMLVETRKLPRG